LRRKGIRIPANVNGIIFTLGRLGVTGSATRKPRPVDGELRISDFNEAVNHGRNAIR